MSNKTSDKNVATEDDVRIVKAFIDYAQEVIDDMEYERPVDVTVYQKDLTSMQNILAEREQQDKRIKELEEEIVELKKYNRIVSDRVVEYKKNSIPKQTVIDKIEELKKQISIDICIENNLEKHYELKYKIDVLQELLEGGRK